MLIIGRAAQKQVTFTETTMYIAQEMPCYKEKKKHSESTNLRRTYFEEHFTPPPPPHLNSKTRRQTFKF